MASQYDAIIIGAGIIGGSIGHELAAKRWKTLNVDRLPAAGYGSTGGSCAIIRTHYSTFDGSALAYEGFFYWDDWASYLGVQDERGLAKFHKTGCVVMKTRQNRYLKPVCDNMDALGIPWEDWDAERVRKAIPVFDTKLFSPPKRLDDPHFGEPTGGELAGGVFFPLAGYISDPQLASHNVQRAAEARGGEFLFNAEVVKILRADGRVTGIELADGRTIASPVVINVAGPHSSKINRMAGVEEGMKIKTRALRQEVVHVPAPAGYDVEKTGYVTSDSDIACYMRPELGNNILVGSEDPECDEREWVDPDDYNTDFTDQWRVQALRAAQRIPSLGIPSRMKGVVDLYDVTDDWIPIYDRSDLDGFYMAIGTSGNQFKNAPIAGKMMAALVEACQAGHDHDRDPLTFRLPNIGREISVGFYSRNRHINPESSFSVLG
ncbi:NAD(P)/FAD-dependent oxidoreductase [Oceanibacterium hippocampi]|uniref:N-methyltryptophan oxidase n=1 Tax=Oceanibacterium hippocampi TaxID=745714 RepID=A0A1Y5TAZ6_9PROT|nr:FAD-dependent oxidoreductase [Oceanibacterium hippocampi]SLN59983.1 N-methyltryptophan oxidase [Oceanibacterium hippocampi]